MFTKTFTIEHHIEELRETEDSLGRQVRICRP